MLELFMKNALLVFLLLFILTIQLAVAQTAFEGHAYQDALKAYKSKNFEVARAHLSTFHLANAPTCNSQILLGKIHLSQKNYVDAIHCLEKGAQLGGVSYDCLYHLALCEQELSHPQVALQHLEKAIELKPDFVEALNQKGICLEKLQQEQSAKDAYTAAIKLRPEAAKYYFNRANVQLKLKQYAFAIADLSKALELDSSYVKAFALRANAKLALQDKMGAVKDLNAAALQSPADFSFRINKGKLELELGLYPQAREDFEIILKSNPQHIEALIYQAVALSRLGKQTDALAVFRKAEKVDQKNPKIFLERGNTWMELQKYKDAKSDYKDAIELDPSFSEAYYNLARAKMKLGDLSGARADLDKTIELNPKMGSAFYVRGFLKIKANNRSEGCQDLSRAGELGEDAAYDMIQEKCR